MKEWFKRLWARIKAYVGVDGLLHFLICYAIVVTFGLLDWIPGVFVALFLSVVKECFDYSYRDKTKPWDYWHTFHDLLFDLLGILLAVGVCLWLK